MNIVSLEAEKKYLETQVAANKKRASKNNAGNIVGFILFTLITPVIVILGVLLDLLVVGIILGVICFALLIFFWCQGFLNSLAKQRLPRFQDKLDLVNKNIELEKNASIKETKISTVDDLLKYKKLLDAGVITQAEFDAKKKELL